MTKIGEMPYLNSEIFYLNRVSDFEYIKLTPKKMGVSISDKKINAGPISLVDFIKSKNLKLLSNYCVSTKKSANSVFLFSKNKIENIEDIYITDETSTSVMLLKALNHFYWKNNNIIFQTKDSNCKSKLIIGDSALKMLNNNDFIYKYDLGFEWNNLTGLPFVFALWAYDELENNDLSKLDDSINLAIDNYNSSLEIIIKKSNRNYLTKSEIVNYLEGFTYRVGDLEEKAINTFKEMYNEIKG
ncbi:MAG: menaquinone biosynthetic enzyme MqnA/MqnD family protein [Dehalococcoidia bacterium]